MLYCVLRVYNYVVVLVFCVAKYGGVVSAFGQKKRASSYIADCKDPCLPGHAEVRYRVVEIAVGKRGLRSS